MTMTEPVMPEWPADNPERRNTASLIPYAGNPMSHPRDQIELIKRSMLEYGWTNPVLIDEDGGIIAGHGRIIAAMQLGIQSVPVIVAKGWPEARKRAYVIGDNQMARLGDWDRELLRVEVGYLQDADYQLDLLGFAEPELMALQFDPVDNLGAEWKGMPSFDHRDQSAFRSIIVNLRDQKALDEFEAFVGQKISEKTRSVHYPEQPIETYVDKRYEQVPAAKEAA